jgi:hypothetical protein
VRNERIRFLRQSILLPLPQCNGGLVTRLVSAKSLSCVGPLHALPDVAFPPVGRLGLTSPPSAVLCDATTATCPSRGPSLVARSPIPCVLLTVCALPAGLVGWSKRPNHARACGHPVPQSGMVVKEPGGSPKFPSSPCEDMPRSQTPVVSCALAKAHPGLLPSSACQPSASHHDTHFGAQSRGLPSRYTRLRTAPCGEARGFATDRLARR